MFISLYVLNTTAKSFHFDIYESTHNISYVIKVQKRKLFCM